MNHHGQKTIVKSLMNHHVQKTIVKSLMGLRGQKTIVKILNEDHHSQIYKHICLIVI